MKLHGRQAVREALRGRRAVGHVWATDAALREPWLEAEREGGRIRVERASAAELAELAGSDEHQGVVCQAEAFPYSELSELLGEQAALLVALDEVKDPHNLGAVARVAEGAGAAGLVIPRHRSVAVTAAVCRASAGAIEHLRVAQVRNLADALAEAKRAGAWIYGADAGAEATYTEPDYGGAVVLVLGSEQRGLRPRVAAACDLVVSIPLGGAVSSLNVATAAAVVLFEARRQRLQAGLHSVRHP